ncbi:sulfatase-like hydrolase/transferase [Thalassoglobus sp. JC818]|uniref:sulfatase family protein n=1 Tax=Thalassoglobus sp. JC818 TaxID=3232136 RepID=UPI00345A3C99
MTFMRLLLIGSFLACWCQEAISSERPNVILVMCDDLGWSDVRFNNPDSPINTPHLDEMAKSGMRFERFYSAGSVCSPTRGSCLTGRHPHRYGVYSANTGHLKAGEITLPEILREQGYTTGHFGKWHLGTLTTEIKDANRGGPKGVEHFSTPQMNGYDRCFVTESKVPTYDPMIKPPGGGQKGWDYLKDRSEGVAYGTRYWNEKGEIVEENLNGDDSRIIMDRAIPFIEQAARGDTPFFAAIWFHAPHLPVVAGPEHVAPYEKYDSYERNYYGCISALDEQVGRLRATLKTLGVDQSTMIWFCSDNGPEGQSGKAPGSASPFRGRKRSLYEGGVRVPAIVEWPGHVPAGAVCSSPAVTSDYLPTVLEAMELTYPDDRPIDGVSLTHYFDGSSPERGKPIGFQFQKQRSWVTDQFKLYSSDSGKTWELYDLSTDPSEEQNIAADHPDRVKAMAEEIQAWIDSCANSDAEKDYSNKE